MNQIHIKEVTEKYLFGIESDEFHRYKSWDNCFKAFGLSVKDDRLALELGFYLASWGMYRGSGGLLQKNHLIHKGAVDILFSDKSSNLRCDESNEVDINGIDYILALKDELSKHYGLIRFNRGNGKTSQISPTDTLLSKVMLGTLGCVPAYDRYFIDGLRKNGMRWHRFNKESLLELFQFIDRNRKEIDEVQQIIREKFQCHYPIMKIVDMYFWQIGYDYNLKLINNTVYNARILSDQLFESK